QSQRSECRAVITDIPCPAIATARARAERLKLIGRSDFALATGSCLPFRDATFDAVVHPDTLCYLGSKLSVLRPCRWALPLGSRTTASPCRPPSRTVYSDALFVQAHRRS